MSQSFCFSAMLGLVVQPLAPAFAADPTDYSKGELSAGDTAKSLPDVDKICESIDNALAGRFVGKDGKTELKTVLKPECANLSRSELAAKGTAACYTTMSERIASTCGSNCTDDQREKAITATCQSGAGNSDDSVGTYCAIHALSKTDTQTKSYCSAYQEAKKSQGSTSIVALLDTVAAGACWAEYLTMKKAADDFAQKKEAWKKDPAIDNPSGDRFVYDGAVGNLAPGSIGNMSICGGAALTASAGELFQTVKVLLGNHSGGDRHVNSNNNVVGKEGLLQNLPKVIEVIGSTTGSMIGARIGLCYYGKKMELWSGLCKGLGDVEEATIDKLSKRQTGVTLAQSTVKSTGAMYTSSEEAQCKEQTKAEIENAGKGVGFIGYKMDGMKNSASTGTTLANKCALGQFNGAKEALAYAQNDLHKVNTAYLARARMAHQAAIIYTGLAAMRVVAIGSAEVTKKKTTEILQSMFASGGGGISAAGTAMNGGGANLFTLTGNLGYTSVTHSGSGKSSAATASMTPESFMLPPSSAAEAAAQSLAKQVSKSAMDNAVASGAGGVAGMMASIAASAGGKDSRGEIASAVTSAFANIPKETGGYGGSSGGRAVSSSNGDSGGDLNLKSLFAGGGDAAQQASASGDMAFRELASEDDIWHSKNPKGNNLFQIVSDKYGTVQMKHSLGK